MISICEICGQNSKERKIEFGKFMGCESHLDSPIQIDGKPHFIEKRICDRGFDTSD